MIKVHGAPKPHACPLCPKCFLSRTELRLHEAAKHRGEKLFVCEECGHRASSRNGLQMHIKAIHSVELYLLRCFPEMSVLLCAHLRRHLQIHNRVENYSPRQRRLRNLIVEDESTAASSSPPSHAEAQEEPADIVKLVIQSDAVVVQQVVSASAEGTGGEQATYSLADGAVSAEQTGIALTGMTDGKVEQTPFTVTEVMEQTLLVTDAYSIHQPSVVVELPGSDTDEKV
ncbi:zinc finger and BTB domain-containing 48-like protein [Labeo rohita]|uniref:Zinc finger and BTB domain-containing 48-like protein n=1 Tax=Labeo rohita TaxID=84645 RepID=A0A498N3X1_LABRO|nr:zinc finger and BTB domain-containing 48-like protein [Labeo rohita]